MNPSALRIRAISCFTRDAGISTTSCRAISALRMRVSISAIESVITPTAALPSPARLDQAGDLAAVSELPEADAAQAELPEHRPGPAAPPAGSRRDRLADRGAEQAQQLGALLVGARRRHDGDVHPPDLVHLIVVDLREDQLLPDPDVDPPAAVHRPDR